MFGFLKQKISDFGNKLKKTILKEEEKIKSVESKETSLEETTPKIVGSTPKKISGVQSKEVEQKLIKETKKEVKTKKNKEPQKATPLKETNSPSTSKTPQISGEEKTPPKRTFFDKLFKRKTLEEENTPSKELKLEEENVKEKILKPTLTPKIESKKIEPKISGKPKKVVKEETLKEKELDEIEELLKEDEEPTPQEATLTQKKRGVEVLRVNEDKRELKAKIDVGSGLKGFLFGGVEITEKQIEELLFELELSLLESDVELEATTELVTQIKQKLVGTKIRSKNINEYLNEQIKEILTEMMRTPKISVIEETKKTNQTGEPYKIILLGPNGAGKTTSIAKLVNFFQKNGFSCILAAGDTFRAGAIDQLEVHAKKLGVKLVKHKYGADPAAIAFDAISSAKANKINVVLIDSAGRQETNKNLMEELKKLNRVTQPNLKIFVGESYAGQGLLDQVKEFEEMIGVDGFILTKLDTDAKGGTAISLTYKTKKPIIFIGVGQEYDDFEEFSSEYILDRII